MASTSNAQAQPMEDIHSCQTHTEQPGYNYLPPTHQETVNVQPVYSTQMYPHINTQQTGSTVVLVVSSSVIRLINFIMDHSPFRQTFELGIFIRTGGGKSILNFVKW